MVQHIGPNARVFSFEAVLETYYMLAGTIMLNGMQDNILALYGVVGNTSKPETPAYKLPMGQEM